MPNNRTQTPIFLREAAQLGRRLVKGELWLYSLAHPAAHHLKRNEEAFGLELGAVEVDYDAVIERAKALCDESRESNAEM